MNLQPEEKENRSFCIKWISTRGCAFKAFLKKVNAGEKKGKRKLWMYRQTLPALSKKEKTRLLSITHTKNKRVYQVCVHIFIFVCFVSEGFLLLSYPGEEGTSGEPLQNHHR